MKKLFAILFAAILVFALCACAPAHVCGHVCPECGKCLDAECTEGVCKDKCEGHVPAHVCESKCPVCGKCTDLECTEDACKDKCAGHHVCESKCETCGKCTNLECTEDVCKDKCEGHHVCESKCETCGKCTNLECTEDACKDKCEGHTPEAQNMMLFATFTNNARVDGANSPVVEAAGEIALVPEGKGLFDINAKIMTYVGEEDIDSLVGLPVTAYILGGKVTKVEARGDILKIRAGEYTLTEDKQLKNIATGEIVALDVAAFTDNKDLSTNVNRGLVWGDTFTLYEGMNGIVTNSDLEFTLVDQNGDGVYDYARCRHNLNAVYLAMVEDGQAVLGYVDDSGAVIGTFGCNTWTGWINGQKFYDIVCADGVEVKEGDRVNGYLVMDQTAASEGAYGMMMKLYITSVCEEKTGVFTEINQTDFKNITVKVDGVEMQWSDNASTGKAADGTDGVNSGRTLMTAENNGKTFTYYCDEIGRIVFAKLAQ